MGFLRNDYWCRQETFPLISISRAGAMYTAHRPGQSSLSRLWSCCCPGWAQGSHLKLQKKRWDSWHLRDNQRDIVMTRPNSDYVMTWRDSWSRETLPGLAKSIRFVQLSHEYYAPRDDKSAV